MDEAWVFGVASGAAGSIAISLAALRLRAAPRLALRGIRAWHQTSMAKATAVLAVISAIAIAGLPRTVPTDASHAMAQLEAIQLPDMPSLLASAPGATNSADDPSAAAGSPELGSGRKDQALASLRDFASRMEDKRNMIAHLGSEQATPAGSALPDVDTMMDRLRERLATNPDDLKGWMTLGWAYANTGKYQEAKTAYEAALKLDSGNDEIKSALEQVVNAAATPSKAME